MNMAPIVCAPSHDEMAGLEYRSEANSMSNPALSPGVFLTARWRHLAMLSYPIDPAALESFLPPQLELDYWQGKTYLSVVGFQFLDARLFGIPIPFHQAFPEVNLRFYVVRRDERGERRGVIFIREVAPRRCVGIVARRIYHESYLTLPVRHSIEIADAIGDSSAFDYSWRFQRRWNHLRIETVEAPQPAAAGSLDEFIVDHYWAYTRERNSGCREYRVDHRPWQIRRATKIELNCEGCALYGAALGSALEGSPDSAFVADGSAIAVHRGVKVDDRTPVAEFGRIPTHTAIYDHCKM
jgi:uncharacterized protein YqjF (DUF2071 family)